MEKLRQGVLGSGKGSNYRAIQEAILRGELDAETRLVISDVEGSGILEAARRYGVRAEYVAPGRFRTKMEPEAEERIVRLLKEAGAELVVLAGYMRMVKEPLLEAFPGKIINIHPSLLPAFPGLEAWTQALAAGVAETGCTVHPVSATPAASACFHASSPGKAGSSEGWILMIFPGNASSSGSFTIRM